MRKVGFLVFDDVTMLDVSGPAEVLSRATDYELVYFSPTGGSISSNSGLSVSGTLIPDLELTKSLDTLIIAGSDALPGSPWPDGLIEAARILTTGTHRIASVCTGAFILAELGLLNGRHATTHWKNAQDLARRYPKIRVDADILHVHDGQFITSAGISAGIDLALSIVEEDHGASAAREIAQEMVVFMHRPGGQSQFTGAYSYSPASNSIVQKAISIFDADPTGEHTLVSLAHAVSVSTRHLSRLFQQELGITPARWIERMRLSRAQKFILDGFTISATAQHSGFGSDENLRRAFSRSFHMSPTEYRARFSSTFRTF
ncbi:GlxA family transcriptional regulator [Corynebacterium crudilactis]|uniref:AraC family transcriptional regulator n=1 Tax=Corynebacterium crudilactis TaxID=1652495 RepID=A0A172QRC0_9CORY|nr:helix-turn-helix domain-containing protein [Corynebacterium crudilactis]ANE03221.1 AraC family transcriptional regulator [Corynebacterium crudilactis]